MNRCIDCKFYSSCSPNFSWNCKYFKPKEENKQ